MIVYVERTAAAATSRVLHTAKLDGVLAWDGPLPSPGSTGKGNRVVFRGYVMHMSDAAVGLLTRRVRGLGLATSSLVGASTLWADGAAFVADVSDPGVISLFSSHVESGLFLSPHQILLHPDGDLATWQQLVTDLAE